MELKQSGDLFEYFVADLDPIVVVELLKCCDIKDGDMEMLQFFYLLHKCFSIWQACERIVKILLLQLFFRLCYLLFHRSVQKLQFSAHRVVGFDKLCDFIFCNDFKRLKLLRFEGFDGTFEPEDRLDDDFGGIDTEQNGHKQCDKKSDDNCIVNFLV